MHHTAGTDIKRSKRTWLLREMQLENFLSVHFHASHVSRNYFVGAFDIGIGRGEVGIALGEIGAADHLVFVRSDEEDGGTSVARDQVEPEIEELDRILWVALAIAAASRVALVHSQQPLQVEHHHINGHLARVRVNPVHAHKHLMWVTGELRLAERAAHTHTRQRESVSKFELFLAREHILSGRRDPKFCK